MSAYFKSTLKILFDVLHEIFDESSYSRFLKRQNLAPSKEAYAEFIREQGQTKSPRPRCC